MRTRPLSTALFALVFSVPVLACAGSSVSVPLDLPTTAPVVVEPTPEPTPAPPVHIGVHDFTPAPVTAADQPGSEPIAKKKKDKDKKEAKEAKPKGPQSGVNGPGANFDSFVAARDAIAMESEKMAALFVQAMIVYTKDQELGHEMISSMLRPKDMKEDSGERSGFRLGVGTRDDLLQLLKKQYIMPGYCGGTPEKEYKDADTANCTVTFDKEYSSRMQGEGFKTPDHAKYFITNNGSQYPRPIELSLLDDPKTGKQRWYIKTFSGLLTGVTRPEDLD